jgi:RHS repeat-associated protein
MKDKVAAYQNYITDKYNCVFWTAEEQCHAESSDPLGPHYSRRLRDISFIDAPPAIAKLWIYRRSTRSLEACGDKPLNGTLDLATVLDPARCRRSDDPAGEIRVDTGDVIYLGYKIHPHLAAWLKPAVKIAYMSVDGDAAFNLFKSGSTVPEALPCRWKDQIRAAERADCLLARQTRYEYELGTGLLPTAPGAAAILPPGSNRSFGGRLEIPADFLHEYQIYFDVMGEARDEPAPGTPVPSSPPPGARAPILTAASSLPRLFRQDITNQCAATTGTCVLNIAPACAPAAPITDCATFSDPTRPLVLASRITVLHRVSGVELPVRNISQRLADLHWRVPPHVRSELTEKQANAPVPGRILYVPTNASKITVLHLPVAMGEPDLEYVRVEQGRFDNPDTTLDDGDARPDEIFFQEFVDNEPDNVLLTRIRQTLALCAFAEEVRDFISARFSTNVSPYPDDYLQYWRTKVAQHEARCDQAKDRFKAYSFTSRNPETSSRNTLRLPFFLRNLPFAEQITSAETLLERVLNNLALGEALLTDAPRLSRRGYRLPVNVNPFDCEVLNKGTSIIEPVSVPKGDCAYRLSANFAMQEFEEVVARELSKELREKTIKNMRDVLARFQNSHNPAFRIDLMATANGRPVAFTQLSGELSGNDPCTSTAPNTCMGMYGSRAADSAEIAEHFYPKRRNGQPGDRHGDVFQRITLNKRTGRTVAFSNAVMLSGETQFCPRPPHFGAYPDIGAMELKQDCPIPDSAKYIGSPRYVISYTIGENNQFDGRNRVFEFRAKPLDVLELHIRLSPIDEIIPRNAANPIDTITGKFSVFDGSAAPPVGIARTRYMIPRAASQILTPSDGPADSDVQSLICPQIPDPPGSGAAPLPVTCRPWTRLGWTEILLGAQYRTYSDAQKAGPGDNRFSVLRRRDMLRLHPEIEVKAEEFALAPPSGEFPRLDAVKQETHLAFYSRDPNVWKTGGDWALFGGKGEGRALRQPLNFNIPQKDSLRYGDWAAPAGGYDLKVYERANDACGPAGAPNYDGCENHLGRQGTAVLTLKNVVWFPLEHQFIGPAIGAAYDKALLENPTRPQTGVCAAEAPNAIASCWKGVDDTVFLERAVSAATVDPAPYSVSALVGFERPPIVQFLFEFESYRRLACIDPQSPSGAAGVCPSSLSGTPEAAEFPNRPIPPSRAIEVFAPVQSSRSQSVSHNEGLALFNTDHIDTRLVTTRQFRDVNGDGYPDVISNGTVELTSPVGLSRRDWWTYFRITDSIGEFGSGLSGSNFDQGNNSVSGGAGIGLSANTAAKFQPRATKTKTSGSTDAAVDPGFDLSIERGYDESFVELRDFNGDGIADKLSGGTIGAGLRVQFNAGNTLGAKLLDPVKVRGGSVDGYHFNTSHSAGFGVRLGFSYGAGSFLAGMGLSHRDGGSQAALIDFTGDGRPDIVVPADGGLLVFPNLGNGFGPGRLHRLTDWNQRPQVGTESGTTMSETTLVDAGTAFTYGFTTIFFKMVFTPGIKWTHNQTRELLNIRDINGDGVPDVVTVSGSFLPAPGGTPTLDPASLATRVHYNPNGKYHMLAGITNPSGSRWVLRHALLGNSGPENGRPVWALTGVARYDGYVPERWDPALPPDGHDVLLTTYSYAQGYYNRAERQFYGFASRTSRNYGCNTTTIDAGSCLRLVEAVAEPDWPVLSASGYRKLQVVHQTFSNRDFLTQGLELSRTVAGATSTPDELDNVEPPVEAVSRDLVAYTVDDLQTLTGEFAGQCAALNRTPIADSWNASSFSVDRSALAPTWEGSTPFPRERGLLGSGGVCGSNLKDCAETLRQATCDAGFVREQRAFWAQQSGSVRRRLITLQSFGGGVPVGEPALLLDTVSPRLHSAVAFDHDQWGQVVGFNSVGEANSDWNPQQDASTNAIISYAPRQGLNAVRQAGGVGYPMLALAQDLQIFGGPWREADSQSPPLRAREALYSDNRREGNKWKAVNRSDVCVYPGGEGFRFTSGICAAFKRNMRDALGDGYSTIQDALRSAYAKTTGLPKGETSFDAIVHHQLTDYDAFGNLLHAISPISRNKEWIERRFDYAGDPFRRTPTTLTLTRCVNDVPGAGTDGPNVERLPPDERPRCTFGLDTLPDPILRKPITHRSQNRIDSHFGSVAESRDLNENRLLFDFDRWGRLSLLARAWGNAPRENRTLQGRVKRAIAKDPANAYAADTVPLAESEKWHVLSAIDYEKIADGLLRSNVRRFESSDSYSGLLGNGQTTRETAMFADGLGRLIQSIRETDVCVGVDDDFMVQGRNTKMPAAGLADRCTAVATGVVTPGTRIDALGRDIETFEPYPISHIPPREGSWRRFENLEPPPAPLAPLVSTSYDGAGRPLLVESRLSRPKMPNIVQGSAQYRYRVLPQDGDRLPRFEALSLSPRCTASAVWSDARGLRRMVFEDQEQFYPAGSKLPMGTPPIGQNYQRNDALTRGFCASIESIANQWTAAARQAAISSGGQPARVNYAYDPLQQLTGVDSPLAGPDRARIAVRFDLLGRMREMQEPNSGCTRYEYDGLNALISETGFRHEEDAETPCGTTTKVRTQKSYDYAAGRMVRMSYRSLEEQGAPPDERDSVRIFYDRSPSAILFGTPLEALRFVPNDQANQRFIETAGRACDNCIGQATVITDRTGARAYSFNELGLARREVRSIVAPVREVQHSKGLSETYLPEVAFYEVESAYTAFGDPVQERFSESAPINPANACFSEGVNTCLSRFTIGRKYAPDGALAQLIFNNRPLISAAQDAFGRPAMRWTKSGIATGYRYDERDLRLNRMTTLTASYAGGISFPVQFDAYQYDGGGNILDYSNRPLAADYESAFSFEYDAVNRLTGFRGAGRRGDGGSGNEMTSAGEYAYDAGHRFKARSLTISGGTPASFQRRWRYTYGSDPRDGPVHAPRSIGFAIDDAGLRDTILGYDDLGRMTRMRAVSEGSEPATGLLSNRAMTWDAEGRLIRVRGVRDGALPLNERALREDYVYDRGGNRTLKIDRPWVRDENDSKEKEGEAATLYLTPFYARPYDRRGTVQLAHGSLPAVGLAAPADVSEDPFATYIYSDLPAGSMTVAVTVFGEPTDINAIVTGRREYSPYGLELTTDGPATTGRGGSPPLSVFHGKELDRLTNFSSFGARYYSRDLGMWLKPDPNLARRFAASEGPNTSDLSSYSFVRHRPTAAIDPDGNDAMVVVFPDYLITVGEKHIPYLGHAGVVIINSDTGATKYYEYGRYDRGQIGVVRLKQVPNLIMEAGQPTAQSMRHLMQALANIGHGSKVAATYDKGAVDYTAMVAHAEQRLAQNTDAKRTPYGVCYHNCYSFAEEVAASGRTGLLGMLANLPSPRDLFPDVPTLKSGSDLTYDPKTGKLGGGMLYTLPDRKDEDRLRLTAPP